MESSISVIVPVYNVGKYLNRCMESIIHQTRRPLEIILVDDSSTDFSGEQCELWAKKDTRIKVIHKKNAGLGMARNTGLEICTGDYIAFVDSDDFIEPDMFEKMLTAIGNNDADTCYCSHQTFDNDKNTVSEKFPAPEGEFSGTELLLDILGSEPERPKDYMRLMSACCALFSGEIIRDHNLRFESEREYICEDLLFDVQYLSKSKKAAAIKDCLYNYCVNTQSVTHKYFSDRLAREKKLYRRICEEMEFLLPDVEYKTRYNRLFLGRVRNCILQETNDSGKTCGDIIKGIGEIASDPMVRAVISEYPIRRTPVKQRIFNTALKLKMNRIMFMLAKLN